MTYNDAKAKAMKIDSDVNSAWEYKGAYVFMDSHKRGKQNASIVILKSNGNVVTMSDYVISYKDDSSPKKLTF